MSSKPSPTDRDEQAAARPLDFGELWERVDPRIVSDALLTRLLHDAEIEAGEEDGDCVLPLGTFGEGVLSALRELKERRGS